MNGILVFDQNQVVEEVEGVVKLAGAASHSRHKIRGWNDSESVLPTSLLPADIFCASPQI